jgi:hypothetical protein
VSLERPVLYARAAVFSAISAWMLAGPVWAQLLDRPQPWWAITWTMYSGYGTEVCAVQYWRRTENGDRPIDRYRTFGWDSLATVPRSVRAVQNPEHVVYQGQQLCDEIPADDVRADAKCGSKGGWELAFAREDNLCELPPAPPPPVQPPAKKGPRRKKR